MSAYLSEWLGLLLRWFHVVAAIAWIGESFYFVMLDRTLAVSGARAGGPAGHAGQMWSVHGGGFYRIEKYLTAPGTMPDELHWSRWKSYATWLSGFTLFLLLYLAAPGVYLVDPDVARLSGWQADALALGFLLSGWLIYDLLCRSVGLRDGVLAPMVALFAALSAYAATHLFSGRAAFLIEGAMLATIMAGNVVFVIIPGQKRMVAALQAGRAPDPAPGLRGRQRSVHNTYFTLPVVFTMNSNHYAFAFSGRNAWLVLLTLMFSGALIRQFFVSWHGGRRIWLLPAAAGAGVLALIVVSAPRAREAEAAPVPFARIAPIIAQRCAPCHAEHPTLLASAPAGVMLDRPDRIVANAARIYQQAVVLKAMPLGNVTRITPEERAAIGAWVAGRG